MKGEIDLTGSFAEELIPEEVISDIAPVSALEWSTASRILVLPDDVRGLRILDVGAGGSDVTATLLEMGADAYAIDPIYRSKALLKGEVRKENRLAGQEFDHNSDWRRYHRESTDALDRCVTSMKSYPDRYRTATADSLPFPDNYFNIVFSVRCVSLYLDMNSNTLSSAVNESLRVTKEGGFIQLFPWDCNSHRLPSDNDRMALILQIVDANRLRNQLRLINDLNSRGDVEFSIIEASPGSEFLKSLLIHKKPT